MTTIEQEVEQLQRDSRDQVQRLIELAAEAARARDELGRYSTGASWHTMRFATKEQADELQRLLPKVSGLMPQYVGELIMQLACTRVAQSVSGKRKRKKK